MAGSVVYGILSADSNVTALVSTRIFPVRAAQGQSWPFVSYQVIDNNPTKQDSGPSPMDELLVQVNCYADKWSDVENLASTVRTALDGYSGTVNSTDVRYVEYEDEQDLFDNELEKGGKALDFEIAIKR